MACFHHENTRWRQPILSWNVSRGTQHDIKLTQTEPPIGTSTRWVYDISSIRTYTVRTQSLRNSVVTRYTHVHQCVMRSTWKVRNGEARSAVETTPCCPLPIPACSQSANKVNRSGADAQVISCIVTLSSFILLLSSWPSSIPKGTSGFVLAFSSTSTSPPSRWHHEQHVPKRYVN